MTDQNVTPEAPDTPQPPLQQPSQPQSRLDPRRLRVRLRVRPRLDARGGTPRVAPGAAKGPPRIAGSLLRLSIALALVYGTLGGGLLYWQVMQAHSLTTDPANPIVLAAARDAPRGTIYASNGDVLADN